LQTVSEIANRSSAFALLLVRITRQRLGRNDVVRFSRKAVSAAAATVIGGELKKPIASAAML